MNMAGFCLYRVLRAIYVTLWFYFMPFFILFGSYYIPYYLQTSQAN